MKRPLMGLSIALAAGIVAGWFDLSWYIWIAAAIGIIIILKYWTDSSYKYLLGLSVLFVVGFCRMMICSETDVLLNSEQIMYLFEKEGDVRKVVESNQSYKSNRWWRRTFVSQDEN